MKIHKLGKLNKKQIQKIQANKIKVNNWEEPEFDPVIRHKNGINKKQEELD